MAPARLLHAGSVSQSMGVYIPAKIAGKAMALARLLLCLYLMDKQQFALWLMALMGIDLGALIFSAGGGLSLIRYASSLQEAGRLKQSLRRLWTIVAAVIVVGTVTTILAWSTVGRWLILARGEIESVAPHALMQLTVAAAGCAAATAAWHNIAALYSGLRLYRLVSVLELLFELSFLASVGIFLAVKPTALMATAAYGLSLLIALALGLVLMRWALSDKHDHDPQPQTGPVGQMLRYGLGSLGGQLAWRVTMYTGLYLAKASLPDAQVAVFGAILTLTTMAIFLGDASWIVILTHATRSARAVRAALNAYKPVAWVLMSLSMAIYLTSTLWIRILPAKYSWGQQMTGPLLARSQMAVHLGLLLIICRLQERPWAHGLAGLIGSAMIVLFWQLGLDASDQARPLHLAWACGAGLVAGGLTASAVYFLLTRTRLDAAGWLLLASPAILLAPPVWAATIWLLLSALLIGLLKLRIPLTLLRGLTRPPKTNKHPN